MSLTNDQEKFLEECNLEFSDRYTDADLDYKKVYDQGITRPPIMCPWYPRFRHNNRDRAGGSRYQEFHGRYQDSDNQFQGKKRGGDRDSYGWNSGNKRPRY